MEIAKMWINEWTNRGSVVLLYTMEFYSNAKKNEIMKYTGKWLEVENIILLGEVTQIHIDNMPHVLSNLWILYRGDLL